MRMQAEAQAQAQVEAQAPSALPLQGGAVEEERGGRKAGRGWEVAWVIPNPAAG